MRFNALVSRYFNSSWLASLVCFVALLALAAIGLGYAQAPPWIAGGVFIVFGVAVLGMVVVAVGNFVRRRWWQGFLHLAMLLLAGGGLIIVIMATVFATSGPSEDHFADDLNIPQGIEVTVPTSASVPMAATSASKEHDATSSVDDFQSSLLGALRRDDGGDSTVSASVDALVALHSQHSDVLMRYLAANPAWRVFAERGGRYATRRWMLHGQWLYTLHGYYTRSDLDVSRSQPYFQFRLTLGLSGKPWARFGSNDTGMKAGQSQRLVLSTENQMHQSHLVIDAGNDLVVEVLEQSNTKERRLTKECLHYLQTELAPLAAAPEWETIHHLLPPGSIRHGQPTVELQQSLQPGIYDVWIWANPGEPGMVYLKAFEITKGTALSVDRLKQYSNEWIGWSDDPAELFLSNTTFTIYEGDWGKPYAARFEVWFAPDRGGPERKLLEKVFKIEGWQR